jgi:hypothetical protein
MQLDHACLCNLGLVTVTSFSRSSLDTPPLSHYERTTYDIRLSNVTVLIPTILLRAEQTSQTPRCHFVPAVQVWCERGVMLMTQILMMAVSRTRQSFPLPMTYQCPMVP